MIYHKEGKWWFEIPVPPEDHTCDAQTEGMHAGRLVSRCACGAVKIDSNGHWMERNTRKDKTSD